MDKYLLKKPVLEVQIVALSNIMPKETVTAVAVQPPPVLQNDSPPVVSGSTAVPNIDTSLPGEISNELNQNNSANSSPSQAISEDVRPPPLKKHTPKNKVLKPIATDKLTNNKIKENNLTSKHSVVKDNNFIITSDTQKTSTTSTTSSSGYSEDAVSTSSDTIANSGDGSSEDAVSNYPKPLRMPLDQAEIDYGKLLANLFEKNKRYPRDAQVRGWEGAVKIEISIDGAGNLVEYKVVKSSSYNLLDQEALDIIKRSLPLPKPPKILNGTELFLNIPINFKLYN